MAIILYLVPLPPYIQVFENKSTQSENAGLDKDQIKNEEPVDTIGQSDSYDKVEEKVGIGNNLKSSHNLIQLPEPKDNESGQEVLVVKEIDVLNNNVEKDNNNEVYEEKKSESILHEDLGYDNDPSNENKQSQTEAELIKSEDLPQLEKQEESKINSSSIEELFALNVEKETESKTISEGIVLFVG